MSILVYCGAHHGNTLRTMAKDYDRVIAFEPNPKCVEILTARLSDVPGIVIVPRAVAATTSHATLHCYCPDDGSGSLGVMNEHARELLAAQRPPGFFDDRGSVKVPTVNLYHWLEESDIRHVDMLVTDCQGMDLTILRTLAPMLEAGTIGKFQSEVDHDSLSHYDEVPPNRREDWIRFMSRYPRYVADSLEMWPIEKDLQKDVTWTRQ